jgi:hypothetical protein
VIVSEISISSFSTVCAVCIGKLPPIAKQRTARLGSGGSSVTCESG